MGPNPLPPDSAARRRRFNGGSEYFAYIIEGPPLPSSWKNMLDMLE